MGGGVIRTATKIPGIHAVKSALCPSPAVLPAEQSLRSASRNVSSAIVSSQKPNDLPAATVDKSSWELDEWQFDDGFENWEVNRSSGEPMPRVVFGGVPSYDEAKEATTELKDALEKVYLSSNNSGTDDAIPASQLSGLSLVSNSCLESKTTVASEAVAYAVPSHAVQAFKLLSQSPAAQSVVASIASDTKVWNAVLQNEALKDFVQSQKTMSAGSEFPGEASAEDACTKDGKLANRFEEVPDGNFFENLERGFISVLQNIKLSVVEMVSNISSLLHNIFSLPGADEKTADDANSGPSVEKIWGTSFIGLAVLVVMVVLLKRV